MENSSEGAVARFLAQLEQYPSYRTLAPVVLALGCILLVGFAIKRLMLLMDKLFMLGHKLFQYLIAVMILVIFTEICYAWIVGDIFHFEGGWFTRVAQVDWWFPLRFGLQEQAEGEEQEAELPEEKNGEWFWNLIKWSST